MKVTLTFELSESDVSVAAREVAPRIVKAMVVGFFEYIGVKARERQ